MSKKIVVLITGQLRYFNELNYKVLKNRLKEHDLGSDSYLWLKVYFDWHKRFILFCIGTIKLYFQIKIGSKVYISNIVLSINYKSI